MSDYIMVASTIDTDTIHRCEETNQKIPYKRMNTWRDTFTEKCIFDSVAKRLTTASPSLIQQEGSQFLVFHTNANS